MTSARARLTLAASLLALLVVVATPAGAAHTSGHTADQIWAIVDQAEQDMDDVVDAFETEIAGLGSEVEVTVAENEANGAVVAIWTDARKAIEDLVKLYPAALGGVGGEAKQQLQEKHNESRIEISDLADAWVLSVPTTTTTTTVIAPTTTTTTITTTTTTTTPTTTTTTNGSGSGVTPPRTGSGGGNGSGPANSSDQGLTSTGATDAIDDQVGSNSALLMAQIPEQAMGDETAQVSDTLQTSGAGTTAHLSAMLETVLPPAVVELVLSPLLILEICSGRRLTADNASSPHWLYWRCAPS